MGVSVHYKGKIDLDQIKKNIGLKNTAPLEVREEESHNLLKDNML